MTVIAYRDGIMACDSAWSTEGYVYTRQNKIFRLPSGALYGAAGDSDDRALVALLNTVTRAADIPARAALVEMTNEIMALLVLATGEVWSIDTGKDGGAHRVFAPFIAVGCGKSLATGAMAMGATARTAAKIAAKFDTHCCLPVHTLKLNIAARRT